MTSSHKKAKKPEFISAAEPRAYRRAYEIMSVAMAERTGSKDAKELFGLASDYFEATGMIVMASKMARRAGDDKRAMMLLDGEKESYERAARRTRDLELKVATYFDAAELAIAAGRKEEAERLKGLARRHQEKRPELRLIKSSLDIVDNISFYPPSEGETA